MLDQAPISSPDIEVSRFFALIIGIDNYQDSKIPQLKGCANDSTNIYKFLTETLHASPHHIKHLRNEEATREHILSVFEEHLIGNDEIKPKDPILFYFAGHGSSEVAPESWHAKNNRIETICPYDDRTGTGSERVRGIPDRTYDSLMRRLASIKGDNIVSACFYYAPYRVMIDCFSDCHHRFMSFRRDETLLGLRKCAVYPSS